MIQLRNNGIYKLPNEQRTVYALALGNNEFFLYDCEYGTSLPPRFSVNADGTLINWFKDFPVWTVEDLTDTGENFRG